MSFAEPIFEALASPMLSLFSPFNATCPVCYADLRWISFFGKQRIQCLGCKREWVKDKRGRWQMTAPEDSTQGTTPPEHS